MSASANPAAPRDDSSSALKPFYYEAFGLVLGSDFSFPDMEETDKRNVDITINRRAFMEIDQSDDAPWTTNNISLNEQIFVWKTLGAFRVTGGTTIDIDPLDGVESKILSLPLFMIAGGYKLLSDDVVAITFDQAGQPKVMPAFNQVKLLDDAARKFGLDLEAAEQIHPQIEKRRHQAQGAFCDHAADAMQLNW